MPRRPLLPLFTLQSSTSSSPLLVSTLTIESSTTANLSQLDLAQISSNNESELVNRTMASKFSNEHFPMLSVQSYMASDMIILPIVQVASTLACIFFSSLAFKMKMHRISFSLPMILVTPICLILSIVLNHVHSRIPSSHLLELFSYPINYAYEPYLWHIACGFCLWFISHIWINNHILLSDIKKK